MIKSLWSYLSRKRQIQFWMLLLLILVSALAEMVSIGAILPFLGVLTAPEQIYQYQLAQPLIIFLELKGPGELILPITLVFILAVLLSNIIRLMLLYSMTMLSNSAGADISVNIYRKTLYQDYLVHSTRNSSEIINGITAKTNTAVSVITSLLVLISSVIMFLGIVILLFQINAQVAMAAITGFGLIYLIIILLSRKTLKKNSECIAQESSKRIKTLQEGLGGIRDILLDGSQDLYTNMFKKSDLAFRRASAQNVFISSAPRYMVEAIGMILIAGLAYVMTLQQDSVATVIPVLGVFALGAQKLLPALQQAYSSYSSIKGSVKSFQDILDLLDQPLPEYIERPVGEVMEFRHSIKLVNIGFRYSDDTPWVFENINLELGKNKSYGFIGFTGSGKSTLLDIIMGLIEPTKGVMIIDSVKISKENKRNWQEKIAHVPQNIFLSDGTIEENIAFGIPKKDIDIQRVKKSAKQAQLEDTINKLKDGYQTFVGERGMRLSGGQKQRIGIARALYKKANVLVFDEATSALDSTTEREIIREIEMLNKGVTVLIIAHRLTTLKGCDQIVKLEKNKVSVGSYQKIIDKNT